jgi:predicted transcriptional regulator
MENPKVDVVAAILKYCISPKNELRKIHHDQLDSYLEFLLSKNFIELQSVKRGNHDSAKTTEKGARFLELYDAIKFKYITTE